MAEKNCEKRNGMEMSTDEERVKQVMQKADDGALNIVSKILSRPEVQNAIASNIAKQAFVSGLFMAFLVVGVFTFVNVSKAVLGYGWQGDALLGIVFVLIGGGYMFRKMFPKKK